MLSTAPNQRLQLFHPPYRRLEPLPARVDGGGVPQGEAIVWNPSLPLRSSEFEKVRHRPGGVALLVVLPPSDDIQHPAEVLRIIELCRPQAMMPYHPEPNPEDLRALLRRRPENLPSEITEYLAWRGVILDPDTLNRPGIIGDRLI